MRFGELFKLALCAVLLGCGAALRASNASNAAAYEAALAKNLGAASAFLADPLNKALAFSVASQGFAPPTAKPLLGFNLGGGVGLATTVLDKGGVKASADNNGADLNAFAQGLPDSLPVPLGSLNLHFGLPKLGFFDALDVGVKYRGLNVASDKVGITMTGLGFEVRGNLFEAGLVSPVNLTLGLGVDTLKTELRLRGDEENFTGSFNDGGGSSNITGTTNLFVNVDSQIISTNLFATVSRKFLFVEPYLGLGLNVISGDTTVVGGQVVNLSFAGGGGPTVSLAKTIEGKNTKPAPSLDSRVAGGLVFHIFVVYLELGGEYGIVSGGTGGHVQFGFKFR
jgi:hypothetical protein